MTELFGAVFARGKAAEAVADRAWLAAMVRVEAALAEAAAASGAIDAEAAQAITEAAEPENFDLGEVAASAAGIGNPVGGIVDRLRALVPEAHRGAVHYGATSQDVLDTAMMLVARDAMRAIASDLRRCTSTLNLLDTRHGDHRMQGRTLLQAARPVEFRSLIESWHHNVTLARHHFSDLTFHAAYFGPVDRAGDYEPHRVAIHRALAERLDLKAEFGWHTSRHPVVRIGSAAAEAAGACAKVAVDVILLSQNEIGELSEGSPGGSTSMPHKRNPVAATCARACAARTPGLLATLYAAMPQELQRSPGLWHSEWETLSDLLRLTGSAAAWLRECLSGLQVHPEAMARNLKEDIA